jgi:hypothetical protein
MPSLALLVMFIYKVHKCKIWGFHGGDYEECRHLECYIMWLSWELTFGQTYRRRQHSSKFVKFGVTCMICYLYLNLSLKILVHYNKRYCPMMTSLCKGDFLKLDPWLLVCLAWEDHSLGFSRDSVYACHPCKKFICKHTIEEVDFAVILLRRRLYNILSRGQDILAQNWMLLFLSMF